MNHGPRRRHKTRLADVVAGFFLIHRPPDELGHLFVASAGRHESGEVVLADREQTGANLAVGGDADAAALSAEGVRHGSDDTDLADTVFKFVAASGFAALVFDLAKRHELCHTTDDFIEGDDDLGGPDTVFLQRHELDEADNDSLLASETAECGDLVIVEAAQEDTIHLDR